MKSDDYQKKLKMWKIYDAKKCICLSIIFSIIHVSLATYVCSNLDYGGGYNGILGLFLLPWLIVTFSSLVFCIWLFGKFSKDVFTVVWSGKDNDSPAYGYDAIITCCAFIFPLIFLSSALTWDRDGSYRYLASFSSVIVAFHIVSRILRRIKRYNG